MRIVNEQFKAPLARFPHICWEPLHSVPPLRIAVYDQHQVQQSKSNFGPTKTSTKTKRSASQVRDADALVVATLASRHLLQQVRQRTGLQQTQLAHIVAVHWTDIRDLESGARPIPLFVLEKVSRALDTQLTYNGAVPS